MKKNIYIIFLIILSAFSTVLSHAQPAVNIETGVVFSGYNNVRIPGDGGTLFSLNGDLMADEKIFFRLRLNYTIGERHEISLLYAPLTLKSYGSKNEDILFEGVVFPEGSEIEGEYKFNSYRLTYRYDFIKKESFELGAGFTAKIRDAKIALTSGQLEGIKTNVGFVPIINFRLLWNFRDNLGLLVYGDALAAPQGRAEDVLVALRYRITEKISLTGGYRILEGGADNDEVYNFALLNYAVLGLTIRL